MHKESLRKSVQVQNTPASTSASTPANASTSVNHHEEVVCARITILGFACNLGFVFSLLYLGFNKGVVLGNVVFERAELFGMLFFMVLAFLLVRTPRLKLRNYLLKPEIIAALACMLVISALLPWENFSTTFLILKSALLGLLTGAMLVSWGCALEPFPINKSVPEVFIGSALGAAICFVSTCAFPDYAHTILAFLPLGSAACLSYLFSHAPHVKNQKALDATPATSPSEQVDNLALKILAGTAVFGLSTGFMETYASDPGMQTTPNLPITLLLFIFFCLAALQLFNSETDAKHPQVLLFVKSAANKNHPAYAQGPLDDAYRLSALLMMAGFLFVPVLGGFGVPGEAIVLAGYLGLWSVLLSLFLIMGRVFQKDSALCFAQGFAALFAGEMLGIVLGNVFEALSSGGQTPYIVVALAGLATLFSYLFLFTDRDFCALCVVVSKQDKFEEMCKSIARKANLSDREAQLLPLALKGRTGERIAQEFCISKSTVETHLRRIYTKCGVHSRQELIDLGEEMTSCIKAD